MIDVHQNATLSESFEGERSRVIGNRCNCSMSPFQRGKLALSRGNLKSPFLARGVPPQGTVDNKYIINEPRPLAASIPWHFLGEGIEGGYVLILFLPGERGVIVC